MVNDFVSVVPFPFLYLSLPPVYHLLLLFEVIVPSVNPSG